MAVIYCGWAIVGDIRTIKKAPVVGRSVAGRERTVYRPNVGKLCSKPAEYARRKLLDYLLLCSDRDLC